MVTAVLDSAKRRVHEVSLSLHWVSGTLGAHRGIVQAEKSPVT